MGAVSRVILFYVTSPKFHTPQEVWDALKEGNKRFVEHRAERPHTDQTRRLSLVEGQDPRVVVLSCSDSRAPVELVFDLGLGDAFVIRTAGHIVDHAVLASLEFAIENLGCSLIVVMGHQSCGAIKATAAFIENGGMIPPGFQRTIVEKVSLSTLRARQQGKTSREDYERSHTNETVRQIMARMPSLAQKIVDGSVGIVGTRYVLDDSSIEPVVLHGVL